MKKFNNIISTLLFPMLFFALSKVNSQELIIGEERVEPGIVFIFEGAVKDTVHPESANLAEDETNVHIEARVNWDAVNIPDGAIPDGFIPYLRISSTVYNENTGLKTFVDLIPHINLIDNFHYARNIYLPGGENDLYTVEFYINPPENSDLAFHMDWTKIFGNKLIDNYTFIYKNINFLEIVNGKRAY